MGNVKRTSWKKGQSGNPKGRPALSWSESLRKIGNATAVELTIYDEKGDKRTYSRKVGNKKTMKDAICAMLYMQAMTDRQAAVAIMDREEGKPDQTVHTDSPQEIIISSPEEKDV